VGPLRGRMDGLRNLRYGLPGVMGLQDVGLSLGRASSSISSLDLPDRLLEDEPIMLWLMGHQVATDELMKSINEMTSEIN